MKKLTIRWQKCKDRIFRGVIYIFFALIVSSQANPNDPTDSHKLQIIIRIRLAIHIVQPYCPRAKLPACCYGVVCAKYGFKKRKFRSNRPDKAYTGDFLGDRRAHQR